MANSNKKQKPAPKQKITFKELIKELGLNTAACRECTTKNDVEALFAAMFNGIVDAVQAGRTIKIYGFGNFSPKTYKGRTQRSGLQGVPNGIATFDDVKLMKFKLSAMAKDVLAGNERKVRTGSTRAAAPALAVAVVPDPVVAKPAKTPKAKTPKAAKTVADSAVPVAVVSAPVDAPVASK